MWPFKCTLIEVKTFKCGCTCVLTGPVEIIAQVHHDVAIYITFQSKLLPDSISEGQISKFFCGGMPPDPPSKSMLCMLSVQSTLCRARPIRPNLY